MLYALCIRWNVLGARAREGRDAQFATSHSHAFIIHYCVLAHIGEKTSGGIAVF